MYGKKSKAPPFWPLMYMACKDGQVEKGTKVHVVLEGKHAAPSYGAHQRPEKGSVFFPGHR
jgi:hypothetical protein